MSIIITTTTIDDTRLATFIEHATNDIAAVFSAPMCMIGEKLGLYKALAHAGPLISQEVVERSGTAERYVRE
jgi:hypothetical protein